jgi:hypothetical protein
VRPEETKGAAAFFSLRGKQHKASLGRAGRGRSGKWTVQRGKRVADDVFPGFDHKFWHIGDPSRAVFSRARGRLSGEILYAESTARLGREGRLAQDVNHAPPTIWPVCRPPAQPSCPPHQPEESAATANLPASINAYTP